MLGFVRPVARRRPEAWPLLLLIALCGSAEAETRIAVMPFRGVGVTPQDAPMVDGLADMLSTNLAESKGVKVLERTQIKNALEALKIDDSGVIDRDTAVKMGRWLGATHVIVGTLAALGDQVRLDAHVVSLTAGIVEKSARAQGTRKDLFDLLNTLSSRVLSALTGEVVVFTEAPRIILEREFRITVPSPSPSHTQRFVSQPLFEGTDPRLFVKYAADYSAEASNVSAAQPPGSLLGGKLGQILGAVMTTFSNATRVQLLVNDALVATWAADQANSTMESEQIVPLGGAKTKLSVKTQEVSVGPVRTQAGTTLNRITGVVVRLTIQREDR